MNDPGCLAWCHQLHLHVANTGGVVRYLADLLPVDNEGVVGKRRLGTELNGLDVEAFEGQLHRQCPYCLLPHDYRTPGGFADCPCRPFSTASLSGVLTAV